MYLWLNLQPLMRGSAACGLAAALCMVARGTGRVPDRLFPPMVQWDFEAFLEPSSARYAERLRAFVAEQGSSEFVCAHVPPRSARDMRRACSTE